MQSPSNKEHPRHEATAHSLRQRLWYTLEIYNYSRASKLIAIMVSPHRCGFTAAVVAGGPWVSRQHCDDTNHAGGGAHWPNEPWHNRSWSLSRWRCRLCSVRVPLLLVRDADRACP